MPNIDLLVSSISPSRAFGIGQGSVVNSHAFLPTLIEAIERGAPDELAEVVDLDSFCDRIAKAVKLEFAKTG
ncbi:MAG: hypothetical protein ACRC4J_00080 [Cetobacterium sp.]